MFSKLIVKLFFVLGLTTVLLLTAVPFLSAAPSGGAVAYLPMVYAPGQNTPPTFGFFAIVPATQGEPYDLRVQASDPDEGDELTLSALQLPNWLAIQPTITNTWILTGTPTNDDVGENIVQLQVTDLAGGNDVVTFTLTVLDVNDDPYFQPIPPQELEAIEDMAYTLTVTAVDPDGDQITIVADEKPTWLTLQIIGNGQASLTGTPLNEHVGPNLVTLTTIDTAGGSSHITFTITVINVNDDPYFQPIPPQELEAVENVAYTLTVTAVDPDGDEVTIVANEKPAWLTLQNSSNGQVTLTGTPLNEDVGPNLVTLTAIDPAGGHGNITFTITVITPP